MRRSTLLLRIAGALVAAVGAVNVALGLAATGPLQPLASPGVIVALLGLGVLTVVTGVLIWRGSLPATAVALTVAGIVVVVQVVDLISDPMPAAGAASSAAGVAGRLALTATLALLLGAALIDGRRRLRAGGAPPSL